MVSMKRSAGVLLHPTCLPSAHGIGDLGPTAHAYLDWLAAAGVGWWQILPLNPPGPGHSPYSATSTFAGNPLLINPEIMLDEELLVEADLTPLPAFPEAWVDFELATAWKRELLHKAHDRFRHDPGALAGEFETFRSLNHSWLDNYALFAALKSAHNGAPWYEWPTDLAMREPSSLDDWRADHEDEIGIEVFA